MRPTQFNRLEQGDRIEYILYHNSISERYKNRGLEFVGVIFLLYFFLLILALLLFIAFQNTNLMERIISISPYMKISLVAVVIYAVCNHFIRKRKFEELDKAFLKR